MSELVWQENAKYKQFYAESKTAPYETYRIFYDDVMYWPSWSKDCTQDLDALKAEAQDLHDAKGL